MSNTQSKEQMFTFRSTMKDKDSKGRDRVRFYMDQEQVQALIETLQSLADNEKGVKLSYHTGEKTSEQGRKFLSTFGFVSAVQDGPGGAVRTQKKEFVPKAAGGVKAAAAKALGQTVS